MNHHHTAPLDPRRQTLLASGLGDLLTYRSPEIEKTVGPHDMSPFIQFEADRASVVEKCQQKLREFTDDQIINLLEVNTDDEDGLRAKWRSFQQSLRWNLGREPPWYAGGFGHPDHRADFEYWSKMPHFSLEELACLSVGVDPKEFSHGDLTSPKPIELATQSLPMKFLLRQYELLRRQYRGPQPGPKDFLVWADLIKFEAHPEFLRLLRQYYPAQAKMKPTPAPILRHDKREFDMIARLFTAMAIREYGYRPDQAKSPIPKEIVDTFAALGLEVSTDTVRKYLKIGTGLLPKGWVPK